jgi:hypothetical protein
MVADFSVYRNITNDEHQCVTPNFSFCISLFFIRVYKLRRKCVMQMMEEYYSVHMHGHWEQHFIILVNVLWAFGKRKAKSEITHTVGT